MGRPPPTPLLGAGRRHGGGIGARSEVARSFGPLVASLSSGVPAAAEAAVLRFCADLFVQRFTG